MSDNLNDLQKIVREGILRTVIGSMETGFLGRPGGTAETIPVRGRPGYVHVQRRGQSGIEGLVKGNVPMVQDYPVEFRLENGDYVVYGKSVHPSVPFPGDEVGHNLGSHQDTQFADLANGHVPTWSATLGKWINAPPVSSISPIEVMQQWFGSGSFSASDQVLNYEVGFEAQAGDVFVILINGTTASLSIAGGSGGGGGNPSWESAVATASATATSNGVLVSAVRLIGDDLTTPLTINVTGGAYLVRLLRGVVGSGVYGSLAGTDFGNADANAGTTVFAGLGSQVECHLDESGPGWYVMGTGRASSDGVNVAASATVLQSFAGYFIVQGTQRASHRVYGSNGYLTIRDEWDIQWGDITPCGAAMTTYPSVAGVNCCMGLIGIKPKELGG